MDEDNTQAALDAQLLVFPNPPTAQKDGVNPQPAPPDLELIEQQPQMRQQIADGPLRHAAPNQQDRGIDDIHIQEAPRRLLDNPFRRDAIAALKTGLLLTYRHLRRWYYWAYFVSLGLLGKSCLFSCCAIPAPHHSTRKLKPDSNNQDEQRPISAC